MSHFNMSVPHQLSQEEALKRIQGLLGETKKEHGDKISNLQEKWDGNTGDFSFTIMGFAVAGSLTVMPASIDIDAQLPLAASFFKGKIEKLISEKAAQLLR
jgi:hypothetical protein